MSFLKDFKDEISQAVNELVYSDGEQVAVETANQMEMNLNSIKQEKEEEENMARQNKKTRFNESNEEMENNNIDDLDNEHADDVLKDNIDMETLNKLLDNEGLESIDREEKKEDEYSDLDLENELENALAREFGSNKQDDFAVDKETKNEDMDKEAKKAALRGNLGGYAMANDTNERNEKVKEEKSFEQSVEESVDDSSLVSEDVAEVTKGTMIDGNIISEGSMNVYGKIKGNVACRGKLVVCGTIVGSSRAAEIFTNNARIDGDVTSDGSLKIGNGSVIIGNVYGASAVIAGAIQGDVDIHGPVIIDGTAVVQGNIRSRSVQVNNGAAIEGMISQCYADIDYVALFDKTFSK